MTLLIRVTVLALAVSITGIASAGDLVIGHVSLHLGMPQTEVLTALSKEFDAKQVSVAEGKYVLWTRNLRPTFAILPETCPSRTASCTALRSLGGVKE